MNAEILIRIVDDQDNERAALSEFVRSLGYETETYSSAESFLRAFDPARAGCVLLDVCMPDTTGFELLDELKAQKITLPVIITSAFADVPMTIRAFTDGAVGFLQKPHKSHELVQIINKALAKDRAIRAARKQYQMSVERIELLTDRERMVVNQLVDGATNKSIAKDLGVSVRTVEAHRASVMAKTEVESLAELVKIVVQYRAHTNAE